MHDAHGDAIDRDRRSDLGAMPSGATDGQCLEPPLVAGLIERHAGVERMHHRQRRDHGRPTPDMIAMRVAQHEEVDRRRALSAQPWHHHSRTGIPSPWLRGPRIHHDPAPMGRADRGGVALPDIEEM